MHIDAKVLRVDAGASCAGEGSEELSERRSTSAFPSSGVGLCAPGDTGRVFSFRVGTGDNSGGDTVLITSGRSSTCRLRLRGGWTRRERPYVAWCKVVPLVSYKYDSDAPMVTKNT